MARTWLSIRVELVGGMHAHDLWPRPGRILMARPGMTFRMLADGLNDAFARWERSHLHAFTFVDGTRVSIRTPRDEPDDEDLDDTVVKLSRLALGASAPASRSTPTALGGFPERQDAAG
jgi:hypothetical protein